MCYSAQIENQYRRYMRVVGPGNALSIQDFIDKYWERQESLPSMKIPKAIDAWFVDPKTDDERKIAAMIRDYDAKQIAKFEQEIFKQRKRLADAERSLRGRVVPLASSSSDHSQESRLVRNARSRLGRFRPRVFSKLIEIVRPGLHHLSALRHFACVVVGGADLVPLTMRKLPLDRVGVPSLLVQECRRHVAEAVTRYHVAAIA